MTAGARKVLTAGVALAGVLLALTGVALAAAALAGALPARAPFKGAQHWSFWFIGCPITRHYRANRFETSIPAASYRANLRSVELAKTRLSSYDELMARSHKALLDADGVPVLPADWDDYDE